MEEILSQYSFLYIMSVSILGIPQSICVHQALHRRNLLGFLLGLASIIVLSFVGLIMLPAQIENSPYLIQGDWQFFQFILLFAVSVMSIFSLSISAFFFRRVYSKLSRDRQIRSSNWRMIVVALFPVPVVALHTLLLAAAIYFPSDIFSFNLYSGIIDFIFMLPVSSDALLLSGMVVVSAVNALMCTAVFVLGIYAISSKK